MSDNTCAGWPETSDCPNELERVELETGEGDLCMACRHYERKHADTSVIHSIEWDLELANVETVAELVERERAA